MNITEEWVGKLKDFEGWCDRLYFCPGGYETIGWGHLVRKSERHLFEGRTISKDEGMELLTGDVDVAECGVARYIKAALSDNQFSALTDFVFNLGAGNLQASTLRRKLNRGDYLGAADELPKWRKSGGVILRGLVLRRAAERETFLRDC